MRDATYPRVRTRARGRRRVTSVATSRMRFPLRYALQYCCGKKEERCRVRAPPAVARCEYRRVILKICLAPGNTSRVVMDADIVGLKNATRDALYADSASR